MQESLFKPDESLESSEILTILTRLEKNQLELKMLEELLSTYGEKQNLVLQRQLSEAMQEILKNPRQFSFRSQGPKGLSRKEKYIAAGIAVFLFLAGVGSACWGGYAALAPVRTLQTSQYLYGTLLLKAWPKLTEKEKKRLKDLF